MFGTDQHRRLCLCCRDIERLSGQDAKLRSGQRQVKHPILGSDNLEIEQVGITDEISDEARVGTLIDLFRRADLLDRPVAHHRNAARHSKRLVLVMRHVDDRQVQSLLDLSQLDLHMLAQFLVERTQRLVHQEYGRIKDERTRQRHTLLLSAGKFGRISVGEMVQPYELQGLKDARRPFLPVDLAEAQRESDVVAHRHVGKERIILENDANVASLRGHAADVDTGQFDPPFAWQGDAGDQPEQRGLAGTAGAEQGQEFAFVHIEIDPVERDRASIRLGEATDRDQRVVALVPLSPGCYARGRQFFPDDH